MKQKITKVNWIIMLGAYIVEFILLYVFLGFDFNISINNNFFEFIKIITVTLGVDFVFILYMMDFSRKSQKEPKKILDLYKIDINLIFIKMFLLFEIVKIILVIFSFDKQAFYMRYVKKDMAIIYIPTILFFYILYIIIPKNNYLSKKLKILKRDMKKGKTKLRFILINGNITTSSFNLINPPQCKIKSNHIYMNIETDLHKIIDNDAYKKYDIEKLIKDNTIAIIHEQNVQEENLNLDQIISIYEEQKINNPNMYTIFGVNNVDKYNSLLDFKQIYHIKFCDLDYVIEYVEDLFTVPSEEKVSKLNYLYSKINLLSSNELFYNKSEKLHSKITTTQELTQKDFNDNFLNRIVIEDLDKIYRYEFNNRIYKFNSVVPKNKNLYEMFKNAYANSSPYESILLFFNYITAMGKLIQYYLFAKNNTMFDPNIIEMKIVGEDPSTWANQIILSEYKNKDDLLYKNIREKNFRLSTNEEILIRSYFGRLLNFEIEGEGITYSALAFLFTEFRNKVEAHGIINETNVYAVWNLTLFFANKFGEMFNIKNFDCTCDFDSEVVYAGYENEDKVGLGKYVVCKNNTLYYFKDKKNGMKYTDYVGGELNEEV